MGEEVTKFAYLKLKAGNYDLRVAIVAELSLAVAAKFVDKILKRRTIYYNRYVMACSIIYQNGGVVLSTDDSLIGQNMRGQGYAKERGPGWA